MLLFSVLLNRFLDLASSSGLSVSNFKDSPYHRGALLCCLLEIILCFKLLVLPDTLNTCCMVFVAAAAVVVYYGYIVSHVSTSFYSPSHY